MAQSNSSLNRFAERRQEPSADPFAMQLALSSVHARLVPMRRGDAGYELDPSTDGWSELPAGRGFAGYGLGRALRMLLDVLRGLTALHDTFDATGETFAHGEVALQHFRVDAEGVCRLVPLTLRHSSQVVSSPLAPESLGHLAPERLLGEKVDARADVFSAGVLLWEALAGRRLFEETNGDAIIDRLMGEKLQMPQLPPELAWAIPLKSVAARALAVDPYQRFADCAELATAIAIVARERVASHAELANFFGTPGRLVERRPRDSVRPGAEQSALSACVPPSGPRSPSDGSSVTSAPRARPVPTQSSTFPAVDIPASSRRPSTLAPLGPSRSLTPAPASIRPARAAAHKSPFSSLISAESRGPITESAPSSLAPTSLRSTTMLTLGTPVSARAPEEEEEAPASSTSAVSVGAPRSSARPPPLPNWAQAPSPPPPAPAESKSTFSAVMTPLAPTVVDESEIQEVEFRRWQARRVFGIAAVLAVAAVVALMVLANGSNEPGAPSAVATQPTQAPLAVPTTDHAVAAAAPSSDAKPSDARAPAAHDTPAVKESHSAPSPAAGKPAAKRAKAGDKDKDYGI